MAKMIIGNSKVKGFVNFVDGNRIGVGTGSFKKKGSDEVVYKETVTVFVEGNAVLPAKGDYVEVSGELQIGPRKDKPEVYAATMNVKFDDSITQLPKPEKKESAPAGAEEPAI